MTKAKTAAVTPDETAPEAEKPKAKIPSPVIDPAQCRKNLEGYMVYREFFIRLPFGIETAQQVHDTPGLWRRVQGTRAALSKFDRVRLVPQDESWLMEATVAVATADHVGLADMRVVKLPGRADFLYGDEKYQVAFENGVFVIYRRQDRHRMPGDFPTAAAAAAGVHQLYPTTAGSMG